MRRSFLRWCSKIDLDGKPSAYYPRFRPRRLVMPVDPNRVHSEQRYANPTLTRYKQQKRLRKEAERRGAITLAEVPAERTVGDAFRYMLEVCEEERLFDASASLSSAPWTKLEDLVKEARSCEAAWKKAADGGACEGGSAPATCDPTDESSGNTVALRAVDNMWSMLDRTPLSSPVHGVLALRGKALVERTVAATAYEAFPRLRSKHLQALLHESCGLLPSSRVAVRLGFAQHAGVEGDIGMWRELNVLAERARVARAKAAAHRERLEKGIAQQRRWYWRGVVKSAVGRLRMFPVSPEDLQPRLEWVRASMFAFIGFVEMAQRSGEPHVDVETLVMKLYCGQLGRFAHRQRLLRDAEALLERPSAESHGQKPLAQHEDEGERTSTPEHVAARKRLATVLEDLQEELQSLRRRTPDELEVLEAKTHPLSDRADLRREQFASSGGTHAVQSLKDDLFDTYKAERHAKAAPPMVIHSLETQNALKEAQLILKYAPDVAPALRDGAIDVDQVVRKTVEVHETNAYASLRHDQQYRAVEYTVCRLFSGRACIGEGKGETLMEAIQEAALHMTSQYYLRGGPYTGKRSDSAKAPEETKGTGPGQVRVRPPRTEEEIIF